MWRGYFYAMARRTRSEIKRERFVELYTGEARFNGTRAAIMAGYAKKCANREAYRLLHDPDVREMIAERLEIMSAKADVETLRILHELKSIGFANMRDFVTVCHPAALSSLDPEITAAISEIERKIVGKDEDQHEIVKIKLHPKLEALKTLLQAKGELKELHEHSGPDGGPIEVKDSTLEELMKLEPGELAERYRKALEESGGS